MAPPLHVVFSLLECWSRSLGLNALVFFGPVTLLPVYAPLKGGTKPTMLTARHNWSCASQYVMMSRHV
jgi:hypothetical protein